MEQQLKKEILIVPSSCDNTGSLSVAGTFDLFMDIAGEHAALLGIGMKDLAKRKLFWLTVRTRVQFLAARPSMMETVTLRTWPGKPGKLRCERYYQLLQGDTVLAEGKTEWAILNTETGKLQSAADIYPKELVLSDEVVCEEPFARLTDRFEGLTPWGTYAVRSTDIDLGQHMNNCAYVRALMGCFSTAELSRQPIHSFEICFRSACYEGETLSMFRIPGDGTQELAMMHENGTPAVLARVN